MKREDRQKEMESEKEMWREKRKIIISKKQSCGLTDYNFLSFQI